ncbi:MAG: hypothetical protein IJ106_10955 [Parasporobacterium sp.]|nr:hypothetical protein [Parasporobacterium sp.]
MRAVFEIRNGLAMVKLDEASYRPSLGEAAALAKTYGHRMAKCSSLTDPEAFTLFKTIYASMVLEYAETKGITMPLEAEEKTERDAVKAAVDVTVKMLDQMPAHHETLFSAPAGFPADREEGLLGDPEGLPF